MLRYIPTPDPMYVGCRSRCAPLQERKVELVISILYPRTAVRVCVRHFARRAGTEEPRIADTSIRLTY